MSSMHARTLTRPMRRLAAGRRVGLAAAAAALTATAAACGAAPGAPSASSGNLTSSGSAPKGFAGQTLTVQCTEPTSLNPALGPIAEAGVVYISLAYGTLIYQKQDGTYVPDLATKWGYVAGSGNKEFDLTLRPHLKFTDGSAVTPQAVINSLEYFKKASGPQAFWLAGLTSAKQTGALSLRLTFAKAAPDLPYLFSQSQSVGAIIGPKGLANPSSLATQSDGAGPYEISPSKIVPNNSYTLTANPGYWNPAAIHYHQIVVKVIDDPNTILSSLQSGQIDAALKDISPSAVPTAKSAGNTAVSSPYAIASLILADRSGSSPLANLKVRQAINYAVDRKSYAHFIAGAAGAGTDEVSVPGAPGYSPSSAQAYSYDVAKAKKLLKEAGYARGFTLTALDVETNDPNASVAQALSSSLSQIGIQLKVTEEPTFGQYIAALAAKKFQAMVLPLPFNGSGFYTAMTQITDNAIWNPFGTADGQVSSLLGQAASSASSAQREALYEKVSDRLTNLAWFVPMATQNYNFLVSSKIAGVRPVSLAAAGSMDPVGPQPGLSWYPAGK